MKPGEFLVESGEVFINKDRSIVKVAVVNRGDRPIQVGSHYHFYEVNQALDFERSKTLGYRLDIAAGTAVRFEPGQKRTVTLVALGGDRKVFGFQGRVMGELA